MNGSYLRFDSFGKRLWVGTSWRIFRAWVGTSETLALAGGLDATKKINSNGFYKKTTAFFIKIESITHNS